MTEKIEVTIAIKANRPHEFKLGHLDRGSQTGTKILQSIVDCIGVPYQVRMWDGPAWTEVFLAIVTRNRRWQEDSGLLTHKSDLSVTQLTFGQILVVVAP